VFLDRDGTINRDVEYLSDPAELVLLPGAAAGIALANSRGLPVIVVTNQSGVARGPVTERRVEEIHSWLDGLLERLGARIDKYYVCPHHPTAGLLPYRRVCECRKPKPGMLLRAAREFRLNLSASVMIGDSVRDLEAGARAGCQTILVRAAPDSAREFLLHREKYGDFTMADSVLGAIESWLPAVV
jgi:D-glycero-D-manno-heptose 1,7-bisphosphate phosphatase